MRKIALFAALIASATVADATSLKDFWSTRSAGAPHFQSAKSSLALEECIALELSEKIGPPNVIHGERETLITSMAQGPFSQQPIGGARISDRNDSREVFVGALGGFTEKISAVVKSCV